MQIQVQLFSILRDCLPPDAVRGQATIELREGATLTDLLRHLGVDRHLGFAPEEITSRAGWQVQVSGKFETDMGRLLQEGDRVLIFPPLSGGG